MFQASRLVGPYVPHRRAISPRRLLAILAVASSGTAAWAQTEYGPGCPYCVPHAPVVAATTPLLNVSMKWTGITQAPSIANPALGCQTSFKTLMWRRHERASDCVWIPQCQLTARSGGAVQSTDYKTLADPDTTVGLPGDIVVSPSTTELFNVWNACNALWSAQPKGVLAVSCNRLVDSTGVAVARGIAVQGSIAQPWLAVADLSVYCQLNERSLAHELGHVFSLPHVTTAGNLMQTGGTGSDLTAAQCATTRAYVVANTILDPPSDLVDVLFDREPLPPAPELYATIRNIVAIDNSASDREFSFHFATAGVIPRETSQDTLYWVLLDSDNDPQTGIAATPLIFGGITGIDHAIRVNRRANGQVEAQAYEQGDLGGLVPVLLPAEQIRAQVRNISVVICDATPEYQGPAEFPAFAEINITVDRRAHAVLFPDARPGRLFPRGLRTQVLTALGSNPESRHRSPRSGGSINFPQIDFPAITVPPRVFVGQQIPVAVQGFPVDQPLMAFFGPEVIAIDARTDQNGMARFTLRVPPGTAQRRALLGVGLANPQQPNNALTAETVVVVGSGCPADFDDGSGLGNSDGGVTIEDLLYYLSLYGDGSAMADLDNGSGTGTPDGGVTIDDLLYFLARYTAGC